jgi:phosphatidylinositol glycan class M
MLLPLCWDSVLTGKSTRSYMGLAVYLRLPRSKSMAKGGIFRTYVVWLEDRCFVSPCLAQGHLLFWELYATLCKYLYHLQALNLTRYCRWGYPFLYEAYIYHTDRRDHRHNFSPYFYLIYLTDSSSGGTSADLSIWRQLLRSPFTSLIPQLTLSLGTGLVLGQLSAGLPFVWFVQTFTFVLFNRVCTSQYFIWYTLFIPLLVPRINLSWKKWVMCGAVWMGTQALWLAEAYKLEFLGEDVFFGLWVRSLVYVAGHTWVLGAIISGYTSFISCNQHTQERLT